MKPNNTNTGRQTEPTVVISGKTIHDLSPEERALVRSSSSSIGRGDLTRSSQRQDIAPPSFLP